MDARSPKTAPIEDLLGYGEWLRQLAAHLTRSEDAEDAVQETWAAALRSPPDADRPAQPWLAEVLRNFVRRQARNHRLRHTREQETVGAAPTVPSPEVLLERAEIHRILAELVVSLAEPYRSTVLLRYHEGLSAAAIAAAQDIPAGTVRWRLKEALGRLRRGLDARYGGNRRAWCIAFHSSIRAATTSAFPSTGVLLMATKMKPVVLTLVGVLAGIAGLAVWRGPTHSDRPREPAAVKRLSVARARPVIEAWRTSAGIRPGTLEGVVLEADGRPAPGALVALVVAAAYEDMEDKAALRPQATVISAVKGVFRFTDVPAGLYLLTATARGWAPAERTDISLIAGEALRGIDLRLGRGGVRLRGGIFDAGGGPIAGAAVRALALGAGGQPDGARTFLAVAADDGIYQVNLLRGSYRIVAAADGYAPQGVKVLLDSDRNQDFRLAPGARIAGQVVDPNGAPVDGAHIQIESDAVILRPSRVAVARTTRSDGRGAFVFPDVPPGSYRVSGRAAGMMGAVKGKVIVSVGTTVDVMLLLMPGPSVAGRVVARDGRLVAGARVRAGDLAHASSGPDGYYRLEGLIPGPHSLTADAQGLAGIRKQVTVGVTDLAGVDLVLEPEASVFGRVLGRDGQPVPGASVTALVATADALADQVTSSAVGRTDGSGRFALGGLGTGDLRVEAEHSHHGRGVAGPIPLSAGGRSELDVRIGRGGIVRGTVRWEDQEPAVGAIVSGSQRRLPAVITMADQHGRYELGPFPVGEVTVDARPETDALERGDSGTERRLTIRSGQDVDGIDFRLTRRDEQIAAIVKDADGQPVAGATVGIARPYRGVSYRPYNRYAGEADGSDYSVLTDGQGGFTVRFLPKGTFDVWATHPEYVEANAYAAPTGSAGVTLQLARGGVLTGRATDANRKPIAAYLISALLSQTNDSSAQLREARGYVQVTAPVHDASGVFELGGLHPAVYDILVTTPDGRGGRLRAIPLAAGETRRDLHLVVSGTAVVTGRVVDEASAAPLAGVTVVATLAMLVTEVRDRTAPDGSFRLEGIVPEERVLLTLRGDGRRHGVKREFIAVPPGATEVDAGTLRLAAPKPASRLAGP